MSFGGNLGLMPSAYARELEAVAHALDKSQAIIEFGTDGTVRSANQNFLTLMGYQLKDIVGKHHRLFVPAEVAAGDGYRQFWAALGRGEYQAGEFKRLTKEGREVWIQGSYNPVLGADGKPLKLVALEISHQVRVLCFDEFYVSDIADAMILGKLTEYLFDEGVTLVATSNCAPDELYKDGLQRQNFVPAIERLKQNLKVLNVDGGVDYRLRALTRVQLYLDSSGAEAEAKLAQWFGEIAPEPGIEDVTLQIQGRPVKARRRADGVAWFDFSELCESARAAADYIQLAREYHAVILSRVPQLTFEHEDSARRFINLVDEFYDRGVKLLIAAAVPQEQLYTGKKLRFEFKRTQSRLREMQSQEYLAKPHLV